jgi:hypothetical protein
MNQLNYIQSINEEEEEPQYPENLNNSQKNKISIEV